MTEKILANFEEIYRYDASHLPRSDSNYGVDGEEEDFVIRISW